MVGRVVQCRRVLERQEHLGRHHPHLLAAAVPHAQSPQTAQTLRHHQKVQAAYRTAYQGSSVIIIIIIIIPCTYTAASEVDLGGYGLLLFGGEGAADGYMAGYELEVAQEGFLIALPPQPHDDVCRTIRGC